MNQRILTGLNRNRQVKDYICEYFCEEKEPIMQALRRCEKEELKTIHVPANVAKILYLFGLLVRPKKILEIGTLGGYSTLWLASTLEEGGHLITIECEKKHAKVAYENFVSAGMENQIEIRIGLASEVLHEMIENGEEPFDLIFIDADKENYPNYLEPCIKLSHSGTLILSDNLIPKRCEIGSPDPRDNEALGIYAFNQLVADHPMLDSVLVPTLVGDKGRLDALGVSLVR